MRHVSKYGTMAATSVFTIFGTLYFRYICTGRIHRMLTDRIEDVPRPLTINAHGDEYVVLNILSWCQFPPVDERGTSEIFTKDHMALRF